MKSILQAIKRTLRREPVKGPRCAIFLALIISTPVQAEINIPSDGSDGVLNITQNTEIDLSLAVTGQWNDSNAANAGKGIYDPIQWAVVFKYSSVNVGPGATVTFKNHPSHAPVVWLVQGDVAVLGLVELSGKPVVNDSNLGLVPTEPGPGGFRGGARGIGAGGGYGPAGYSDGGNYNRVPYAGSYGGSYGNPSIIPLMGGSGNQAVFDNGWSSASSGTSGGGAMLIASRTTLTLGGQIRALGGPTLNSGNGPWGGGGDGAIRLVADRIVGAGAVNARNGRSRVEANALSPSLVVTPNMIAVPPGLTPQIWPLTSAPAAQIASVNKQVTPAMPLGSVQTSTDINIQTNGVVEIIVETKNFPPNGKILVRVVPKYASFYDVGAGFVSGTFSNATWKATTALPQGFCVLQAHATSP